MFIVGNAIALKDKQEIDDKAFLKWYLFKSMLDVYVN